jgi:hypothetical protein
MPCSNPNLTEIMIPRHVKERMKLLAKSKGISMPAFVSRCVNAYCKGEGIRGEVEHQPVETEDAETFERPSNLRGRPRGL